MSILECKNLSKDYGNMLAVNNVNLNLQAGQIVGLLGPNGSGKTTLIKMATGLLRPTSGEILIEGNVPGVATKGVVAYLPDRDFLPDYMNTNKLIKFYCDFYDDFDVKKAEQMLESLDIDPNKTLKKLSKGMKEKVQLILTMSRNAKVYFLDEPIAGVDPAARDYILKTIITNYNPNALVLISTHLIADIESVLDEAVFLKNGKVALHKNADEIREESGKSIDALFREVFKC